MASTAIALTCWTDLPNHRQSLTGRIPQGCIMEFEWDPNKADSNRRKHGTSFAEGVTVFGDPLAMTFADPDHSRDEQRYVTFGQSDQKRLLLVSHTDRGSKTRIISVRPMIGREKRIYEEG